MVSKIKQITIGIKALRLLGWRALLYYAWYKLSLHSGLLAWQTRRAGESACRIEWSLRPYLFPLPDKARLKAFFNETETNNLLTEADEAMQGRYRRFGGETVPYNLAAAGDACWTRYEKGVSGLHDAGDVKFIWEDGRLGWIYPLFRAYRVTGDERYIQVLCDNVEKFLAANPPGYGYHWVSAQEVALRLIGLVFAYRVIHASKILSAQFTTMLAQAVARHAARIPPSLAYARAQNNNHLLSEAAGLFTAGLALQDCSQSRNWRETGWRLFNRALLDQIDESGVYSQQSANYQRLMLQLALWVRLLAHSEGLDFPAEITARLAASTRWLASLLDEESGCLPNLGPNDGAYILPLTNRPYCDYRPLLGAAAAAFLNDCSIHSPGGEEMVLWLCPGVDYHALPSDNSDNVVPEPEQPCIIHLPSQRSWAYLRAVRFKARPGHADQCHVDLWWRGINIAQDAGTYSYNADPPWDNPLVQAAVHNTITIDGRDQMTPAGRFLYLDWAQGRILSMQSGRGIQTAVAEHDGYGALGILHRRTLTTCETAPHWKILDEIIPWRGKPCMRTARLHWLLPDWAWEVSDFHETGSRGTLLIESPHGRITVRLAWPMGSPAALTLTRAGDRIYGTGAAFAYEGWVSPTYAEKKPGLSLALICEGELPMTFETTWQFPTSRE